MSAVEQDLADALSPTDEECGEPAPPPADSDEANRRLRRLAKVRADKAEVVALANTEIDRILNWRDGRLEVLAGRERWLVEGLEMWHRAVLADDPSRKTISLPCGTLSARKQQPVWEFDEAAFLAWCEVNAPEWVRVPEVRPSVDRVAVKKALTLAAPPGRPDAGPSPVVMTADGEVVPGVTVTSRPPSFTVETGEVAS